eukprot:Skav213841  [mRNA]  locus=scaffold315:237802:239760:+ [translate_table: standard]
MTRGGENFTLVRNEVLKGKLREVVARHLKIDEKDMVVATGQPFYLGLVRRILEEAGDPDCEFLRRAEEGLPVGVLEPLPRTPAAFEEQKRWPLESEGAEDPLWEKDNYISAEVHAEHLEAHLEQEVREGLMERMSEKDFIERFGRDRAVAALAVLVEDDRGKKRVIHDGSHGVKVNHRIKCLDKVRMPSAREKRLLLEEFREEGAVVLSLVGDVEKAHRRIKYQTKEQGFLGCRCRTGGDIYVNKVGTFGISSTPYWWARISACMVRLVYYILGSDWPIDLLLYADDLEAMGAGKKGRVSLVLAYLILSAVGVPFKWSKQRGGLESEWIGINVDYATYRIGLSEKRAQWVIDWIQGLLDRRRVGWREFAAALGRLGFASLCLPWERPFLGPLYSWSSAIMGQKGELEVPWAIMFILKWIRKRILEGERMEEVKTTKAEVVSEELRIWTDAKATDTEAWIGGWLECSSETKRCPWFSLKVDEKIAPWLKCRGGNPKRVIAALEMLATLVAMKTWCTPNSSNARVFAKAFTDNRGNDFVLKKGMSTKFPLTVLVMEASEMMRRGNFVTNLTWIRRDENQGADDLTNQEFSKFEMCHRVEIKTEDFRWYIMDDLLDESRLLYEEIVKKKEANRTKKLFKSSPKEKVKFFGRWASQ